MLPSTLLALQEGASMFDDFIPGHRRDLAGGFRHRCCTVRHLTELTQSDSNMELQTAVPK